ncbi:hypothetical protein [Clostridium peptidivorans]|uniref:hypothetical protein n=1 Tax=Clostridium peptidivorans TaxID=100174 RepID=UPI000BE37CB8|nr:hypothetical protein [Clostridium peptidivorans]
MTKAEEKMSDLMEEILDKKESLKIIENDLDSLKNQLIEVMINNKLIKFNTYTASATIMNFDRSSLIKDEVLMTVNSVNKGTLQGKIDIADLIKVSPVHFVLVRSKE